MGKFKKGQSGNPSGRPKLTDEDRLVSQMTKETWNELSQKMMTCKKEELEDLIGEGLPYEAEVFIRHMLDLGENPDWHAYTKYLDRRIGKVKDEIDLTVKAKRVKVNRPNGEQVILDVKKEEEK